MTVLTATQAAEWIPARTALVHSPGIEALFGILEPRAANFREPFSLRQARLEHECFCAMLEAHHIEVIDLRQALTSATRWDNAARGRLNGWAEEAITHRWPEGVSDAERQDAVGHLREALCALDPETLADIVILRPTVSLSENLGQLDLTTRLTSDWGIRPLSNSLFVRDPLMTTARGCVVGRAALEIRRQENAIARNAMIQMGIEPICEVADPGQLEGGDFIPCGDFVLQGQGLLTNEEGVRQCLEAGVYGCVEVAVVRDKRRQMGQMHLDTYLAVLDRDLCAVCENRLAGDEPEVDVHEPYGTDDMYVYELRRTIGLTEYLQEKGMRIITFTEIEQRSFAANGFLVRPRRFLGVNKSGGAFARKLQEERVDVEWLELDALSSGYGGLHCLSQVLERRW